MKKIKNPLLKLFSACALFMGANHLVSCNQKQTAPSNRAMVRPVIDTIMPPKDTIGKGPKDTIHITTPKDTAFVMVRDAISDGSKFYYEPLDAEIYWAAGSVPQSDWLRVDYAASGPYKVTVESNSMTVPNWESFEPGNIYHTQYRNLNHAIGLGFNNNVVSTKVYVESTDTSRKISAFTKNALTGLYELRDEYDIIVFEGAERVDVWAPAVNGQNPMTSGNNRVIYNGTISTPRSDVGQRGTKYVFN